MLYNFYKSRIKIRYISGGLVVIYQFKINLKDVDVPVWRRLLIDSDTTFEDFHYILLATFDWLGSHLHEFEVRKTDGKNLSFGKVRIGVNNTEEDVDNENVLDLFMPFSFEDEPIFDQKQEVLSNWFLKEKDRVIYTYDFGDDWEHEIVLEKILEKEPDTYYPVCIKAKNDTPPEDSRYELLNDEIDLIDPDWKQIVEEVNDFLEMDDLKAYFTGSFD